MEIVRTPDERFAALTDFPFTPRDRLWQGMRLHHLDERPATTEASGDGSDTDAPVMLLLHGEPSWSYLYRHWIPRLVAAGFRCVAADLPGFGRSDKPTDDEWYVVERHMEAIRALVDELDLRRVHLVVQDWAGPIGLRVLCDQPDRFERVFIFNTWLHHADMIYGDGIRWWRQAALDPAQLGGDMPTGRIVAGSMRRPGHDVEALTAAYDAPFTGPESKAGARRFPFCIPFGEPEAGNAIDQERCFHQLPTLGLPIHLAFGDADMVFTYDWAERWHAQLPGSTLDRIEGAGHFVQDDAADDCVDIVLRYSLG
jgi:haloalkane dehalogenase